MMLSGKNSKRTSFFVPGNGSPSATNVVLVLVVVLLGVLGVVVIRFAIC